MTTPRYLMESSQSRFSWSITSLTPWHVGNLLSSPNNTNFLSMYLRSDSCLLNQLLLNHWQGQHSGGIQYCDSNLHWSKSWCRQHTVHDYLTVLQTVGKVVNVYQKKKRPNDASLGYSDWMSRLAVDVTWCWLWQLVTDLPMRLLKHRTFPWSKK